MTFGSVFGRTFSPTFQPSSQAVGGEVSVDITVTAGVGADTYVLRETDGHPANNNNYGAATTLRTRYITTNYVKKILFRFDLSSIPSSATIISATLKMYSSGATQAQTYTIYKITDANGDWVEGTGNGTAVSGAPCWNYKAYHATTPTSWAGSAGLSTAGTDYINTVLATATLGSIDDTGLISIPFGASGLTVLQDWFGDASNNGLLLITSGADEYYHSGESTTESYRPVLSVTYSS